MQVISRLDGRLRRSISMMHSRNQKQMAVLLIAMTMALVWFHGSTYHFVPCAQDCGETFVAQQSVVNYHLYGVKYWLLQDHSTIPDPNRHPFIYTHNVHLGTLLFPLLDRIGVSPLWAKQSATLLAFGAGLFYIFLTIHFITKSNLAAVAVLALFCTDYGQVLLFALNALRAWHWLALFGLIFHALRVVAEGELRRTTDLAAMTAFTALSFGIGYEFLAIALGITFFVAILCARSLRLTAICLCWLAGSVILVFSARQAQVIAVFGPKFWSYDVFYSAVIKVTALATYFQIPSLSEIDAFYLAHGVLRPFAAVAPLDQVLLGLKQHLLEITLPSIGVGATASWVLGAILCVVVIIAWMLQSLMDRVGRLGPLTETGSVGRRLFDGLRCSSSVWIDANLTARFYGALLLGAAFSLVAFGSVAVSIYLKHQMPLMAAVVLIPKGIFIALCLRLAFMRVCYAGLRVVAATVAILLIFDHAKTQYQNVVTLRPMPVGWIPEVAKRPDASFAVSWIPSSVAGFTRNWVIGIQPGLERRVLDRANGHEPLFTESDLLEVNILNKEEIQKYRMLQPDYWLYFATDQKAEVQATMPACVRSYARSLFDRLAIPHLKPELMRVDFAERSGMLFVAGELNITGRAIESIDMSVETKVVAQVRLACNSSTFAGLFPSIAASALNDRHGVTITAVSYSGERFPLGTVDVSSSGQLIDLPPTLPQHQPSAETLIEVNRSLPIAAEGPGFVLFDLRHLWKR